MRLPSKEAFCYGRDLEAAKQRIAELETALQPLANLRVESSVLDAPDVPLRSVVACGKHATCLAIQSRVFEQVIPSRYVYAARRVLANASGVNLDSHSAREARLGALRYEKPGPRDYTVGDAVGLKRVEDMNPLAASTCACGHSSARHLDEMHSGARPCDEGDCPCLSFARVNSSTQSKEPK